jgi:hypothetical protein
MLAPNAKAQAAMAEAVRELPRHIGLASVEKQTAIMIAGSIIDGLQYGNWKGN